MAFFLNSDISQGSVVTQLRCGEIISQGFVANLPVNLSVNEVWKSVNIWRSYGQYCKSALLFLTHGVVWYQNDNFRHQKAAKCTVCGQCALSTNSTARVNGCKFSTRTCATWHKVRAEPLKTVKVRTWSLRASLALELGRTLLRALDVGSRRQTIVRHARSNVMARWEWQRGNFLRRHSSRSHEIHLMRLRSVIRISTNTAASAPNCVTLCSPVARASAPVPQRLDYNKQA